MYSDEQIMTFVRKGDLTQMTGLYNRHYLRIYNFFRKTQLDKSICEDLTQNVFERVIKYKRSFQQNYDFVPWLYRIASNVKYDHYRTKKLKIVDNDNITESQIENKASNVEDGENELACKMRKAVSQLETEQQQLIYLTKYEGFKYKEVANILNLTESNVKVKIYRAMKELKNIYLNIQEI